MKLPYNSYILLHNMILALENGIAKLLHFPQRMVDGIGMYRTVSLALVGLVIVSLIANLSGMLVYSVAAQLTSLVVALVVAFGLNVLLAVIWKVIPNHESAFITALILFFLTSPNADLAANWLLASATALAILSKYLITSRKQHVFNPAAIGAVLVALGIGGWNLATGSNYNTDLFGWWVANPVLFWPVLLFGSLIVFKIRRWTPVLWFVGIGLLVFLIESIRFGEPLFDSTLLYFLSYPTLFLAFFMLTEPFTMPPTKTQQAWYGALVGALSSTAVFAPFLAMTPELALVLGNGFAYLFRIRQKLFLTLVEKRQIATDTWEFVFRRPATFTFLPGQYVEWMLPHKPTDSRGLRRYFTIASSPTEPVVRLACKIMPQDGSSYKAALLNLDEGEVVIASQLAGDFVLPTKVAGQPEPKLGFMAGGIGVTPFSSQLSYMDHSGVTYGTALYYCCRTAGELGYLEDFKSMNVPLSIIPVLAQEEHMNESDEAGFITVEMLDRRTPDWRERIWYLSGPPGMVNAYYKMLRTAGLSKKQIKKDFFPGLA